MNPLRTWWESRAESRADYTSMRIAESVGRVSGEQGARGTAVFRACQSLIGRSAAAATLEGEFSESLGPRLSEIARALTDCGESTWEIRRGPDGLTLLPCKISTVTGGADPASWHYSLTRSGPTENIVIERPAEAVLSFKVNAEPGSPYRGVAPLEVANSTGSLLALLESQLALEAPVTPTRILTAGSVGRQASEIEQSIRRGGIVSILQSGATASITDPSGLKAGVLKNESSAAAVALYEQLERAICGACGVPAGLILSDGDGAAARENFRFFAASTIAPLLGAVKNEWEAKIAPLKYDLNELKAADQTARSRSLGSRATAFKNLVGAGLDIERALSLSGLNDT